MADDDTAPVETFSTDTAEGLRQAVDAQRHARAVAEVAAATPEREPEEDAPPKVVDWGNVDGELTVREAAKIRQNFRAEQAERAKMYALGLGDQARDPWAAEAPASDVGRAGRGAEVTSQEPTALEVENARLEAARRVYAEEREVAARIESMGTREQQCLATELYLSTAIQGGVGEFQQLFSDVRTQADLARMQQENPQRFQAYTNYWNVLQNAEKQRQQVASERQQVAQARVAEGTQQFAKVAELHDQAWLNDHPEFVQDPGKLRELQQNAVKYLTEKGLSKEELEAHWTGRASFSLREKISQDILTDAIRWKMAEQHLQQSRNNGRGRDLPPVQRPGQRPDRSDSDHARLQQAERVFARDPSKPKAMVALLQAQRAAGRLRP